ncbi:MAG: 5-formyltetrahydrofolate cyclo-ligase [Lachnospiraceae bacterium]|nr:5-formyltetrahydrofolate cyclo-ligase [Lachnospiraceae bacterium]
MEKNEIRRMVKGRRRELPEMVLLDKSRRICEIVMGFDTFRLADEIFVYMDCKGEVSTKLLMEEAWRLGKKVAAPKVEGEDMRYYYISSFEDVANGYFHVPEPITGQLADNGASDSERLNSYKSSEQIEQDDSERLQVKDLPEEQKKRVLLIVPGVGFDRNRNRCGYGKGFYDRYLAAHPDYATVALAFDFQIVDEVPVRAEDIRPQVLVTESQVITD